MWGRKGKIKEKWFIIFCLLLHILHRLLSGGGNVFIGIPTRKHRTRPAFPAALFDFFPFGGVHHCIRDIDHLIVFYPAIGREINHSITKVVIKTMSQGAIRNRLGPVESIGPNPDFLPCLIGLAPNFCGIPIPSEVPLTNGRGVVSTFFQHLRQGEPPELKAEAQMHLRSHEISSSDNGRSMHTYWEYRSRKKNVRGENHSFLRQFFKMRSGNLGFGIKDLRSP